MTPLHVAGGGLEDSEFGGHSATVVMPSRACASAAAEPVRGDPVSNSQLGSASHRLGPNGR